MAHTISIEKVLPYFKLKSVPGIGNITFKRLIEHFGIPQRVFEASIESLTQVAGISHSLAKRIKTYPLTDATKRDIDLVFKNNYQIITLTDETYPNLLKQIPDPPPFLYVSGQLDGWADKLSIVGSRLATAQGAKFTRQISKELVSYGIQIVSGLARGIDTAAHEGAILGHGKTIAVLGSGLNIIYPKENQKLFCKIRENGAIISEFPTMTPPESHNFPIRNRLISGLSLGIVVVEAALKSGSLITARLAAEQNREVFAVPGSVRSVKSFGTHYLIKQGAKLTENVNDIIEELNYDVRNRLKTVESNSRVYQSRNTQKHLLNDIEINHEEAIIINTLSSHPVHIDELYRQIDLKPSTISSILLNLELKGIIQQLPGKQFIKGNHVFTS